MKKGSLYTSSMTHNSKSGGTFSSSLEHSLRIEEELSNINFNREKSDMNLIFYKEKYYRQSELSQEDRKEILTDIKKDFNSPNTKKMKPTKTQQNNRAKSLKSIKKYINPDLEENKKFYELLSKYEDNPTNLNKGNIIKEVQKMGLKGKVLEKNLNKYTDLVSQIGSAGKSFNRVQNIEFITSIPIDNNLKIDTYELMKYQEDFFKRHFPNHEIISIFGHNDELHKEKKEKNQGEDYVRKEVGQHTHSFLSGKNKITQKYDYYQRVNDLVREHLKDTHNLSDGAINGLIGVYGKQTDRQLREMGKQFQEFLYKDINNNFLKKYDYKAVIGFNSRTKEEKKEIQKDSSKKISERVFNGFNLEQEKLFKLNEMVDNKIEEFTFLDSLKGEINLTKEEKEEVKNTKSKGEVLNIFKKALERTLSTENLELKSEVQSLETENLNLKKELKELKSVKIDRKELNTLKKFVKETPKRELQYQTFKKSRTSQYEKMREVRDSKNKSRRVKGEFEERRKYIREDTPITKRSDFLFNEIRQDLEQKKFDKDIETMDKFIKKLDSIEIGQKVKEEPKEETEDETEEPKEDKKTKSRNRSR